MMDFGLFGNKSNILVNGKDTLLIFEKKLRLEREASNISIGCQEIVRLWAVQLYAQMQFF